MRIIHLAAAAIVGAVLSAPGIARAADFFTTADVNMRAGPSTRFPRVATLPAGVVVDVYGCLAGWTWCDTAWRGYRGWVSGRYLERIYRGRRVLVPDYGPRIGLPIISFHFGSYWDRWYSDRSWYRDRPRWRRSWERDDWSWRDGDWDHKRRRDRDGDWRSDGDWDHDGDGDYRRRADRDEGTRVIRRSDDGERRRRDWDGERARRRANDDVPPGIRRRGDKDCPPGLKMQDRCE